MSEDVNEPNAPDVDPSDINNDLQPTDGEPSATTDNDPGAEPGTDEPSGDNAAAKENKTQNRIDELTRKRREAERDAEYWKTKALEREPQQQAPDIDPTKPQVNHFETYDEYVEALTDWKLEQRERVAEQRRVAEQQQKNITSHNERVDKAREAYPDYDDVVEEAKNIQFAKSTIGAITESDHSADIIYYLCKNKDQAQRVAGLPPYRQLIEIGKIETRFEKKEEPPPTKRVTKAPDPIEPVGNRDKTITNLHDIKDDDEWHRREKERLKKLGRLY